MHLKLWQKYTAKSLALLHELIEESEKYENPSPVTTASTPEGAPQIISQQTLTHQAMPSTSGYIPSLSMGYATPTMQQSAITVHGNQPALQAPQLPYSPMTYPSTRSHPILLEQIDP